MRKTDSYCAAEGSFSESGFAQRRLISHGRGMEAGVTDSLSCLDFLSLLWDSNLQILFHKDSNPPTPVYTASLSEGLPILNVIQSREKKKKKKKESRNWFLIFLRCCISPHLWEHTASIISHLITLSKNGHRTAVVSASRGLTCTLKSNWRLYLMYLFKIWEIINWGKSCYGPTMGLGQTWSFFFFSDRHNRGTKSNHSPATLLSYAITEMHLCGRNN